MYPGFQREMNRDQISNNMKPITSLEPNLGIMEGRLVKMVFVIFITNKKGGNDLRHFGDGEDGRVSFELEFSATPSFS